MRHLPDPEAMVLVAECQAFLDGRYAEMMEEAGATAPPWSWMNLLAHGTMDEIRLAADAIQDAEGWRMAQAYVAGEMVEAIDGGRTTLRQLQRGVLVPLELDVLACRGSAQWTPGQLAAGLLRLLPARDRHQLAAASTSAEAPPGEVTVDSAAPRRVGGP